MINMNKSVFIISQHNVGVGHFICANSVAERLTAEGIKVWHFPGGPPVKYLTDDRIILVQLPVLKRYGTLNNKVITEKGKELTSVNEECAKLLLETFKKIHPQIVITEFFPFSYYRLYDTIYPLLEFVRKNKLSTKFICLLRDIPVSDSNPSLEKDYHIINKILQKYYFAVFHAVDYNIIPISITPFLTKAFKRVTVYETGFISQQRKIPKKNIPSIHM